VTFAHPIRLVFALVALVACAFIYRSAERRRGAQALAYSNVAFAVAALRPARWPAALLFGAYVAGTGALLAALAGPHFTAQVPAKDGAVMICIDTSGSMRAHDLQPTRWDAALRAARAFVDAVPDGTKVGIVSFSSSASVVVPPEADIDAVRDALGHVPLPDGGTAIGDALSLAAQQLPSTGRRIIVLLTDGVNNRGSDPLEAAREIGARGVTIETVGVGSSGSGEIIPGTSELADLDAESLRTIAESGRGRYVEARDADALRDAFRTIALTTVWERKRVDGSFPVALGGGLVLVATFLAGLAAGRL
jgi:Ca-activated chloride channel family protein